MKRLFAALACFAVMQNAMPCRVLDPELADRYQGGCRDGLAEGRGEAWGIARYQGEFHAGREQGKGTKNWPSGDRYEGEFVGGRKQGFGIYVWGGGERYAGGFLHDRRNGSGTYTWPGGGVYTGQWRDDAIIGTPTAEMIKHARLLARTEAQASAAVANTGTRVCRQLNMGISELDWVSGVVVTTRGNLVWVRIDDPGQFNHTLNGGEIAKGSLVWDADTSWIPCAGK